MQSVPIPIEVMSLNPDQGEVYNIMFVSDFRQVGGFLQVLRFPPLNKTDSHNIVEILLKVSLNIIKPNQTTTGLNGLS